MLNKQKYQGFTLIEVLIALSIISISLLAILQTVHTNIINYEKLSARIEAFYVLQNAKGLILIEPPVKTLSSSYFQSKMFGKNWQWEANTTLNTCNRASSKLFIHQKQQTILNSRKPISHWGLI